MKYIMAMDEGTTSARTILFDTNGRICATASREFPQYFPCEGWVEHEPTEIFAAQIGSAAEALMRAGGKWSDVLTIGVTNQRETTVVWDRATGEPIARAIVWQCRRTADRCRKLIEDGCGEMIREKTGLLPDPYFSATKLAWLLEHVEGARERAERGELCFGTIDTWLLFKLTGGRSFATDITNASRTMLCNIHTGDWDDELLSLFRIPRAILPRILPSASLFGETDPAILGAEITVTAMAGDQQAALFGQGCHTTGAIKNTYGTGGFLLMNTGERPITDANGLVTTVAWQIGDKREYALEGSVFVCGSAIQWLRDQMGLIANAQESETLALQVEDTLGVYLVPAFTGLGAPHWDPYARGILTGITRATNKCHIVRAAIEAMAYQAADVVHLMERVTGQKVSSLRVDGGAAANRFLLSFQADILGIPVIRPACIESTALGAAGLAGIGAGIYRGTSDFASLLSEAETFPPAKEEAWRTDKLCGWAQAVARARS